MPVVRDLPNPTEIRQFLFDHFSDEELETLCFDFFPEVKDGFAAGMTKQQKILDLLGYCQRRQIVPNLLAAIQRARPEPYAQQFPQAPQAEERFVPSRPTRDPKQVFISHAHEDAEFAHRLASDLRQNGWRVWIAPDSIQPGEKWIEAINRGLEESSVLALILTPASVTSRWVNDETNIAIEYEHEGRMRLVPLEIERCDVPPLWRAYQRIQFQAGYYQGLTALLKTLDPSWVVQVTREQVPQKAERREPERQAHATVIPSGPEMAVTSEIARESQYPLWPKLWKSLTFRAALGALAVLVLTAIAYSAGSRVLNNAASSAATQTAVALAMQLTKTVAPTNTPILNLVPTATLAPASAPSRAPTMTQTSTATPTPFASITRVAEKDGMVMVYVPAGEFSMGSADSDQDARSNEKPQHKVYLDAFWIDRTTVTNLMFARFVSATGYKTSAEKLGSGYLYTGTTWAVTKGADWLHPGGPATTNRGLDNYPVVFVSWDDAKSYCEWAGRRLPTEAEWEKAARGADGRLYPWGNQAATCEYAVIDEGRGKGCGKSNTVWAVDNKPKGISPYGAADMAGNVWEWVADWLDDKYYDNSSAKAPNPQGPTSGQYRVLRGGSWADPSKFVRSAFRFRSTPDYRGDTVGFRCSR